jgi:hypothetical protein
LNPTQFLAEDGDNGVPERQPPEFIDKQRWRGRHSTTMNRLRKSNWIAVAAGLYAVAMLLLGFSHLKPSVAFTPELAAFVLPDGTQVALCGSGEQGRAPPGSPHGKALCDACMLTSAPGALSAPPLAPAPADRFTRLAIFRHMESAAKRFALAPQSRGPPQA